MLESRERCEAHFKIVRAHDEQRRVFGMHAPGSFKDIAFTGCNFNSKELISLSQLRSREANICPHSLSSKQDFEASKVLAASRNGQCCCREAGLEHRVLQGCRRICFCVSCSISLCLEAVKTTAYRQVQSCCRYSPNSYLVSGSICDVTVSKQVIFY